MTVVMVPGSASDALLSGSKFVDADYTSIYTSTEVNIYDEKSSPIIVTEKAALKGWRCPISGLWRIPSQAKVADLNTDMLLLDSQDGRKSLNSLFIVPTIDNVLDHLQILLDKRPDIKEATHNVYNLPSIESANWYLHEAAEFPAKATCLEAI